MSKSKKNKASTQKSMQAKAAPSKPQKVMSLRKRSKRLPPSERLCLCCEAAQICGVYYPTWWKKVKSGEVPTPIIVCGDTVWRYEELQAWVEAGKPHARDWVYGKPYIDSPYHKPIFKFTGE